MRSIFKKVCKVLGIEKFMYAFPPADGKETIGILLGDVDGIKRGDVLYKQGDKWDTSAKSLKIYMAERGECYDRQVLGIKDCECDLCRK